MKLTIVGLVAMIASITPPLAAQMKTYCIPGGEYTCFGIEVLTVPSAAGTDVTVRLKNLQGTAVPNVPAHVAWSRIHSIDLVGSTPSFAGGPVTSPDPVVDAIQDEIAFGDTRETWFTFNIGDDAGTYSGYGLETPYTEAGAEIVGCGTPADLIYPYFQTCDALHAGIVEFRFSTEGAWQAGDVGIVVALSDTYSADTACLIAGALFDDVTAQHCVDPSTPSNQAPVAHAGGSYAGNEGGNVSFDGSGSSDPDGNVLTYDWNFGDASAHAAGATPTHTYLDNGSYTVTLTVSDGNGGTHAATSVAVITNALPQVVAGTASSLQSGEILSFSGSFSDQGASDGPWSTSIDWGDGTAALNSSTSTQGALNGSHPYFVTGILTLQLTAVDKDAGSGSASRIVTVTPRTVSLQITPNPITLSKRTTVVDVTIFSTPTFDAGLIDPSSAMLGDGSGADALALRKKNGAFDFILRDLNRDGRRDLVLHFSKSDPNLGLTVPATKQLVFRGRAPTTGGTIVVSTSVAVQVVP